MLLFNIRWRLYAGQSPTILQRIRVCSLCLTARVSMVLLHHAWNECRSCIEGVLLSDSAVLFEPRRLHALIHKSTSPELLCRTYLPGAVSRIFWNEWHRLAHLLNIK